jgi:hypothetical protein
VSERTWGFNSPLGHPPTQHHVEQTLDAGRCLPLPTVPDVIGAPPSGVSGGQPALDAEHGRAEHVEAGTGD